MFCCGKVFVFFFFVESRGCHLKAFASVERLKFVMCCLFLVNKVYFYVHVDMCLYLYFIFFPCKQFLCQSNTQHTHEMKV